MSTVHTVQPFEERLLDELLVLHRESQPSATGVSGELRGEEGDIPARRHRRSAKVAVAAMVAGAVAVTIVAQALPGGVGHATPAAAAELTRLAAKAATLPTVGAPGPGQFQYTESVGETSMTSVGVTTYTANYRTDRQIWIGPDGSGRIVEVNTNPSFPTAADRAAWITAGRPPVADEHSDESFAPGGLSNGPVNLWTLPTDVATLASMISSRQIEGGPPGPQEDLVQIGDLLRETAAPPALRAALFEVATQISGVSMVGDVSMPTGQHGIAVAYGTSGPGDARTTLHELVFNPSTSVLIGSQDVVIDRATDTSQLGAWTSYLSSAIVNSTHSTS